MAENHRHPNHPRSEDSPSAEAAGNLAALDAVMAALAHPVRRQILLTIHFTGSASAGDIAGRFAHKWPTTTRHLRVLEDAELLRQERRGRQRVYSIDKTRLSLVGEWLGRFEESRPAE